MDWTILWWLLAGATVLAGLAGTLVPAIPGVPLVFFGLFAGAWIGNFETVGWASIAVLAILTIAAWGVDILAAAVGARYLGASSRAFWGATVGAIAGIFFGLPGILLGPFIGAVLGELSKLRGLDAASRAGVGATIGLIVGTAAKLALGFAMIGVFVVVRFV